ncbi:potassium/proton antiporter [Actinocatenispora rupis]|uniref:Putative Na(+)/H(+) antiporter n=1 Tax=Actinocatenispora rupis TaxID=519421 RepID=A0A8J3NGQ3_9ACTN|nr:potassium/proton antiporter [Actinocatenispora rupis]GID15089.1 putative Na(+)/H(+) antiporter [Actinocatenispora rupis]
MTLHELYLVLLVAALVVVASIAAARLVSRVGLPVLLAYLGIGLVLGESGLGVRFSDARVAQALGIAALAVILIDGGLSTDWHTIRPVLGRAATLATVGVVVSVVVTAVGAWLLLGVSLQIALLLGAVVASTDAAAVFSVLRALPLPPRLSGLLEAESGFNDAPTVILVLAFSVPVTAHTPLTALRDLAYELGAGTVIGLALGVVGAYGLRRLSLPASGLYPLATFTMGLAAFAAAGAVHASGFLSAYLAAIVLGNAGLPHRRAVRSFAEGLGWIAQIGLFVMLGLLVSPGELPAVVVPALLIGLVLLLVARPASVAVSLLPFRVPWREQTLLSWAGLRGAVPIVLATFPVVAAVSGSERLFNIVFVLVVAFTLVQAPTLAPVARALGLVSRDPTRDLQLESAPLDVLDADLIHVVVSPRSRLRNVEIWELRLPDPAVVTMVVRAGRAFVPHERTPVRAGDELLVMTTHRVRPEVEQRLRAVGRDGPRARWRRARGRIL